jgi:hypothetical protein
MADGVDTAVEAVEATRVEAVGDAAWEQTGIEELSGSDHAVLIRSETGDPGVRP